MIMTEIVVLSVFVCLSIFISWLHARLRSTVSRIESQICGIDTHVEEIDKRLDDYIVSHNCEKISRASECKCNEDSKTATKTATKKAPAKKAEVKKVEVKKGGKNVKS